MSIYSSSRKMRKHARSQPGHLKLSACEESSALVVHIYEARGLMRKDSAVLDVYIKLYLLPDAHKSTKKKTRTVRAQDPVFNEKFTFLLAEADTEKRLFISAWTPHLTSRNVMIGCMSFPVASLIGPGQGLNGWYQLLDEEKGQTENQPVPVTISQPVGARHPTTSPLRPGTSEIAVTLSRGRRGFGFQVRGHNPVYISHVDRNESAHQAEVQVADIVARVNDTDVRRANAELVQRLISESGDNLQLILVRDTPLTPPELAPPPPSSSSGVRASSPVRGTNTLPRSHRFPTSHRTHSHAHSARRHAALSSSMSYGTLSQDHLPLMVARSSNQYSSLSHLPRTRLATSPQSYGGSSSVLSQPPEFDFHPQDQFVHDAAIHQSSHSFIPQSHMRSVYEEREEEEEEEVERGEEEADGQWNSGARPPLPPSQGGGRYGRERGRSGRGTGGEFTQPTYHRPHPSHHPPPPPASSHFFSQPGEPEMKSTRAFSQVDHAPRHTHSLSRKRVDVMTGEHRQFRGPAHFFAPNLPSHHRHRGTQHHHDNVELIGHKSLRATRSHGYGTEYGNETAPHRQIPYSRIGMEAPANGLPHSPTDSSPVYWESLSPAEQKRQRVLHSLVEAESTFHSLLQNGIETYLDPLQPVVSHTIHSTLFYNLKELYQVSSRVDLLLKERQLPCVGGDTEEATPHYITHVADIYHSELAELVELLRGYLENLHSAKQELSIAFTNETFAHLVQKSVLEGKNRSIYSFIEAGKDYCSRLFKCLLGAYQYTPPSNVDQAYLSTALRQLARICPDKEAVKRWEEGLKVMQRLDVCISFAPRIPRIPMVVPGRLLVREGDAQLIEKKGKTKVWIILFTDILLITQRRRGTVLMCLEPAIPLDSLRVNDFNCSPDTEFQIMNVEGSLIRLLRVPSAAEKASWMASLKERASGSFRKKHGERISRVNNLPKISDPAPQAPLPGEDGTRKNQLRPHSTSIHPSHKSDSQLPRETSTSSRGGEEGRGGRRKRSFGKQSDLPDLGLGMAATQTDPLDWKRANSKRRSFNLFGGKGKGGDKKKKDKKGDLPSPAAPDTSLGDPDLTIYSVPAETLREWRKSLDIVLQHPDGRVLFHRHLALEHSLENMQFCKAVDHFKTLPDNKLEKEARAIAAEFVGEGTPKALNIDSSVAKKVEAQLKSPHRDMFDEARQTAYELMAQDSFRRFKTSPDFVKASQRDQTSS